MGDFIPTRGSQVNKKAVESFQSVTYVPPKKKVKSEINVIENVTQSADQLGRNNREKELDPKRKQEIEMKRARFDVMKFGMSGLHKAGAENAKVALAVTLGAKPPKKRAMNYNVLKQKRKKEKESTVDVKEESGLLRSLVKHNTKKKAQKGQRGILGKYGNVQKGTVKKK